MKLNRQSLVTVFAFFFALGCSSEEEKKKDPCENDSCRVAAAPDTTPVTFSANVAPILKANCNSATCHGYPSAATASLPSAGLFLGTSTTVDGAVVVMNLLAESQEQMGRAIVVPSDPANSILMHKVDGCQNSKGVNCVLRNGDNPETNGVCGDPMPPPNYDGLCTGDVEVLRRWIAQGAMNN